MEERQFSILFEEMRLLRKQVSELTSLLAENAPEVKPVVNQGLESKISAVLQDLGMPAHIKGYAMAREAIKMVCHDMGLLGSITTVVYPEIAMIYDSIPSRVERAIRHAIEVSWGRSRKHPFYARFTYKYPSNSEFIALIVDKFKLEEAHEKSEKMTVV